MQLPEKLKGTNWTLFFDNFFNSLAMMEKNFENGIYATGKVLSNWKQMERSESEIEAGESDFHYSKNIICCKWYDSKSVLLLVTNVDGMIGYLT